MVIPDERQAIDGDRVLMTVIALVELPPPPPPPQPPQPINSIEPSADAHSATPGKNVLIFPARARWPQAAADPQEHTRAADSPGRNSGPGAFRAAFRSCRPRRARDSCMRQWPPVAAAGRQGARLAPGQSRTRPTRRLPQVRTPAVRVGNGMLLQVAWRISSRHCRGRGDGRYRRMLETNCGGSMEVAYASCRSTVSGGCRSVLRVPNQPAIATPTAPPTMPIAHTQGFQ